MFESLGDIITTHAGKLQERFSEVSEKLTVLVENTTAEVVRNQFTYKGKLVISPASKINEVRFENDTGRDWLIHWVGCAQESPGSVDFSLNYSANFDAFLDELKGFTGKKVFWYLPAGSTLVANVESAAAEKRTGLNILVEELPQTPKYQSDTGKSNEFVISERTPPVPTGDPFGGGAPEIPTHLLNGSPE
jgi:hypothetical protein